MDLEQLTIPAAIAAVLAAIVVLARMLRGGGGRRGETQLLAALEAERDVLRANHAVEVAALERRLADATTRSQAGGEMLFRLQTADAAADEARHLATAHDAARQQLAARIAELSGERDQFAERSRQVPQLLADHGRARAEIAALHDEVTRLRSELAGRGAQEDDRLRQALTEAEARERSANESLSRLAYDRDGLAARIAGHERGESLAKAELEAREALFELRLEKIDALEARLRDADAELAAANQRADAAERAEVATRDAAPPPDAEPPGVTFDPMRSRNADLLEELEELRRRAADAAEPAPTGAGPSHERELLREAVATGAREVETLREAVAQLAAENKRLVEAGPRLDETELERLRAELRTLAERFVAETEATPAAPAGSTLADRIRAYKASRPTG